MLTTLNENIAKAYHSLYPKGIISKKHKLIYYPVPKVASSTVKRFLAISKAVEAYSDVDNEFSYIHTYTFPQISLKELNKYHDFLVFTVVRNPIDRIVSCYKDKIIGRLEKGNPLFPGFKRYNSITRYPLFKRDMSFHQFIKTISMIPDALSDEHFRSQHRFIPYKGDVLGVNRILKFEHLPYELINTFAEVGLEYKDKYQVNASKKNQIPVELEDKTLTLIKKRYKKDFRLFSYN